MNPLYPAAAEVHDFCLEQGWRCCVIGGLAVVRWGRPRVTQDVDITLLTGFGNEEKFVDVLLGRFAGRRPDAREFALSARVLLMQATNGTYVDLALGGLPFEERLVERATEFEFAPGIRLRTASAEDIVITKAFAARHRDWNDVEGILVRQQGKLDWEYIRRELSFLCELKEAPEIIDQLERMRQQIEAG